ncbi:MAG TPA: hypothetical protein VLE73_06800 [Candidatus Saccharimonadales bacterium]|nr:hypothetical protein [Candidatus Saccharimonadales bacterium]
MIMPETTTQPAEAIGSSRFPRLRKASSAVLRLAKRGTAAERSLVTMTGI